MATHTVYLAIRVKAKTEAEACSAAQGALHILKTDTALRGEWRGPGFALIDRATLQTLVDAADFGQDQKDYDAKRLEDDNGRDETTRELRSTVRKWRAAVRVGLSAVGSGIAKAADAKSGRLFMLMWGGGDEPDTPAVFVHKSKAGALAQAKENLNDVCDERSEITRGMADMRKRGEALDLPNETWMSLETIEVGA